MVQPLYTENIVIGSGKKLAKKKGKAAVFAPFRQKKGGGGSKKRNGTRTGGVKL